MESHTENLSGRKGSTSMLLMMLERDMRIDMENSRTHVFVDASLIDEMYAPE